jgi:DNA polymerase III epsilon subunit-like protein
VTGTDAQFKILAEEHVFVVIDVETCPADDGNHIISIAAATVRRGARRGLWSKFVNPGVPITNTRIHGLTDADVAAHPPFSAIAGELNDILAEPGVIAVAHHARFDFGALRLEHARLDSTLTDVPVLDTMTLPAVVGHDTGPRRTLTALLDSFGLTNERPHDAAADATATADALIKLLRVAAGNGYGDITHIVADNGAHTTGSYPQAAAERMRHRPARPTLPASHLATHSHRFPPIASPDELDAWVTDAFECARLRCEYLQDKAEEAFTHHAALHSRLTDHLATFAPTAEPGAAGTLAAALNEFAPQALTSRQVRPWWTTHGATLRTMPRCHLTAGACPSCSEGLPCPLDTAHQAVAIAACDAADGTVPETRRKAICDPSGTSNVERWSKEGLNDLAGYAAWLVADSWAADDKESRSHSVIDHAINVGAIDPRLARAYAQRLALQARDAEVRAFVTEQVARRTTDPGWDDLELWFNRYLGQAARRRQARPAPRPDASPRIARPAGRVRARRFAP